MTARFPPSMPVDQYDYEHPWFRQPCDDDESYVVFQEYLLSQDRPRRPPGPRYRVAYEMGAWRQRALAYDDALNAKRLAKVEDVTLHMTERHAALGLRFQTLAARELAKLDRASAKDGDLPAIREGTVYRYAEVGIRIEREAAAMPSAPPVSELDLGRLSVDELRTLRELTEKAQKKP